jgi:hypothetical protein
VFSIAPEAGLLSWARGTVPTPFGPIEVEWSVEDGRMTIELSHPDCVRMDIPQRMDRKLVSEERSASAVRLVLELI